MVIQEDRPERESLEFSVRTKGVRLPELLQANWRVKAKLLVAADWRPPLLVLQENPLATEKQ
jgi:hypothetical protein